MHRYDPSEHEHEEWTKAKHVPPARAVAYFEGCWRNVVRWRPAATAAAAASGESGRSTPSSDVKSTKAAEWTTLIDLTPLQSVPKTVRPISRQLPDESRRLWESVTTRLLSKEYGEATRAKHVIEQRQRDEAAERKRRGVEWVSLFFAFSTPECVNGLAGAGTCRGILRRISRAACRHLRKRGGRRSKRRSSMRTRTRTRTVQGGIMVARQHHKPNCVRRHTTIYTPPTPASSFTSLYRVLSWSISICIWTTSFPPSTHTPRHAQSD